MGGGEGGHRGVELCASSGRGIVFCVCRKCATGMPCPAGHTVYMPASHTHHCMHASQHATRRTEPDRKVRTAPRSSSDGSSRPGDCCELRDWLMSSLLLLQCRGVMIISFVCSVRSLRLTMRVKGSKNVNAWVRETHTNNTPHNTQHTQTHKHKRLFAQGTF